MYCSRSKSGKFYAPAGSVKGNVGVCPVVGMLFLNETPRSHNVSIPLPEMVLDTVKLSGKPDDMQGKVRT